MDERLYFTRACQTPPNIEILGSNFELNLFPNSLQEEVCQRLWNVRLRSNCLTLLIQQIVNFSFVKQEERSRKRKQ